MVQVSKERFKNSTIINRTKFFANNFSENFHRSFYFFVDCSFRRSVFQFDQNFLTVCSQIVTVLLKLCVVGLSVEATLVNLGRFEVTKGLLCLVYLVNWVFESSPAGWGRYDHARIQLSRVYRSILDNSML